MHFIISLRFSRSSLNWMTLKQDLLFIEIFIFSFNQLKFNWKRFFRINHSIHITIINSGQSQSKSTVKRNWSPQISLTSYFIKRNIISIELEKFSLVNSSQSNIFSLVNNLIIFLVKFVQIFFQFSSKSNLISILHLSQPIQFHSKSGQILFNSNN